MSLLTLNPKPHKAGFLQPSTEGSRQQSPGRLEAEPSRTFDRREAACELLEIDPVTVYMGFKGFGVEGLWLHAFVRTTELGFDAIMLFPLLLLLDVFASSQ